MRQTNFARNVAWMIRHINGETLAKISRDTGINRNAISRGVREAGEVLVEHAQSKLMEDVFPLVTELWREALKAEIVKAKAGKDVNFALIDRLLKGMDILDRRPPQTELESAAMTPQLTEGMETLAGFIAHRAPPKRVGELPPAPVPVADDVTEVNVVEGEVKNGDTD